MRWIEVLNESVKKYEPMFSAFRDQDGKLPSWVASRIRSVENLLGRSDRVVWALRWERINAAQKAGGGKRLQKMARDAHADETQLAACLNEYETMIRDEFPHWFSLGIANIQSYVFDRQSPEQVHKDFTAIEDQWKKARSQIINHAEAYPHIEPSAEDEDEDEDERDYEDDEDGLDWDEREERERVRQQEEHDAAIQKKENIEKIIDFGDGWAWWNLHRTYCTTEGNAMGHCGNGPSAKPGDEVLSLRRDVGNGNYRPSLTFILHEDGMLGETKGRANEKPAERYHEMIIALLKNPLIKGMDGGGYAANHNFSILDLSEEQRSHLLAMKPRLLSFRDRLTVFAQNPSKEGEEKMGAEIMQKLREKGFSAKRIDFGDNSWKPYIVINEWKDREAYTRSHDAAYQLSELTQFFFNLEDDLMDKFCDDWTEAGNFAKRAEDEMFNNIFDALLDNTHADFMLDGVGFKVTEDGRVMTGLTVDNFLSPTSWQTAADDDPTPILDRLRELDQEGYDSDHSWSDIKDNVCSDLNDIEQDIAEHCCQHDSRQQKSKWNAVEAIYDLYAEKKDDLYHYHSDHPNQLSFDFPEKSA